MIDSRFVYLAMFLSLLGVAGYIRDTLRGTTTPNRVTWGLWALEGVLAFAIEIKQHVGLAAGMTLMLGLGPVLVVVASFRHHHGVWRLTTFDVVCGVISLAGIIFWALVDAPTTALVSFVVADQVAALPTVRKSWLAPETETWWAFAMGSLNTGLTLATLHEITTAGALFPGVIMVTDALLVVLILTRVGPRVRARRPMAALS
ncbi:MAG TPA: hypothetical protein VLS91_05230 [Acidimicrobiales bacterium]|nr:hypothetical protein [Acidimicrobiales bacterium]